MKKNYVLLLLLFLLKSCSTTNAEESYFDKQRTGANFMNVIETEERFKVASEKGIKLVRIAPNKWLNGRDKKNAGNFLLGPTDNYNGVIKKDLDYLKSILDEAHKHQIKIILTTLSLPGSRWRQHNDGIQERKIWEDFKYHEESIDFWKTVVQEIHTHPAIIGYNILNEPSPEKLKPILDDWTNEKKYKEWNESIKNTPRDLNLFYKKIVSAIREIDKKNYIVLDSGFYATPMSLPILEPIKKDPKIIYSFHMYEPFLYTSRLNKGKWNYPGEIPLGEKQTTKFFWDKKQLNSFFQPIINWQKEHHIQNKQIMVGEFGIYRKNKNAQKYLEDIISLFNEYKWHWLFYSFREDSWDGMDYELGTKKAGWDYWKAIEQNKMPDDSIYKDNPLFNSIMSRMTK